MLLIERHVSAFSEAIIRFNSCQLYETNSMEYRGLVKIMLTLIVISMTSRTEYGLWYHLFPAKCVSGI